MTRCKRWRPRLLHVIGVLMMSQLCSGDALASEPLVVFLVRHAEKVDTSRDSDLSPAGRKRADELGSVLRDVGLNHIHSSDFTRTRYTAAPIAGRLKLEVELYDQTDLPALVERLRLAGGRHLVVGHSTTTPKVVELLGGSASTAIDEAGEFDRLYLVTVGTEGDVHTVLMRYGTPFQRDAVD